MTRTPTLLAAVAALGALAFTAPAYAQLIAAESFNRADYDDPNAFFPPANEDLRATGPANDGNPIVTPGWSGANAWVSGSANIQFDPGSTPGLESLQSPVVTYDDNSTGKARFTGIDNNFGVDFRRAFRVMDSYTPQDTYYMSALLNPGSAFSGPGKREHMVVGFGSAGWDDAGFNNQAGGEGTPFGLAFGWRGEDEGAATDQFDLIVRARDDDPGNPILTDTVLLAGEETDDVANTLANNTYLLMLKLEVNAVGAGLDRVTYWVNPTNLATEGSASTSSAATGTFNTLAMDQNDRIDRMFVVVDRYEDSGPFFDELRFGYDFDSVRGALAESGVDGDYNNDGVVNAADYTVYRDNLGLPVDLPNDTTPGTVSQPADYDVWANNYGADSPTPATAVPEPLAATIALFGLFGCGRRR